MVQEAYEHIDLRIPPKLLDELDKVTGRHKRSRNAELLVAIENHINASKGTK